MGPENEGDPQPGSAQGSTGTSWSGLWESFLEHVFPELIFAAWAAAMVGVGRLIGLSNEAQGLIVVVGLLALGIEVIIRWWLNRSLRRLDALKQLNEVDLTLNRLDEVDRRLHSFGLAVADHARLGGLASSYIDKQAHDLADLQRCLANQQRWLRLPVKDVFRELISMLELAQTHCQQIQAVASHDLTDYQSKEDAKLYFSQNEKVAKDLVIRRVFVLDQMQLKDENYTRLVRNQDLALAQLALPAARRGGVKWVYKPENSTDERYHDHRVSVGYSLDWVLFGDKLLVKHAQPGDAFASVIVDGEEIKRVQEEFDHLWTIGLPSTDLEQNDESTPKREKVRVGGPRTRSRIVELRAANVIPDTGEVA